MNKIRFGIYFSMDYYKEFHGEQRDYLEQIAIQVRLAETLGYQSVWFTEQHFNSEDGLCPDPIVLLAYLAGITNHIRLGSAVSIAPLHNPIRLAESYGLLDILTNGRIEVGLGSGFFPSIFDAFGIPFDARLDIRDEVIDVLKLLWMHNETEYYGKFFKKSRDLQISVSPIQVPYPQLWIATVALDRVKAILKGGDSVLIDLVSTRFSVPELSDTVNNYFRSANQTVGRIGALLYTLLDEPDRALPYYERFPGRFRAVRDGRQLTILDEWNRLQNEGIVLCCSSSTAIKRIQAIIQAGVTDILLAVGFGGISHEEVTHTLHSFAAEVIPAFRQ